MGETPIFFFATALDYSIDGNCGEALEIPSAGIGEQHGRKLVVARQMLVKGTIPLDVAKKLHFEMFLRHIVS